MSDKAFGDRSTGTSAAAEAPGDRGCGGGGAGVLGEGAPFTIWSSLEFDMMWYQSIVLQTPNFDTEKELVVLAYSQLMELLCGSAPSVLK